MADLAASEEALPTPIPQQTGALCEQDSVDSSARSAYQDLACLAAETCGVPAAMICLMDGECQCVEAAHGIDASHAADAAALNQLTALGPAAIVVPDVLQDERFRGKVGAIRFY
jgi:hypothetical protein